jgi:hypothetical protein
MHVSSHHEKKGSGGGGWEGMGQGEVRELEVVIQLRGAAAVEYGAVVWKARSSQKSFT